MNVFKPCDILIPQDVDFTRWSVVACDQYTSQPKYWKAVEEIVGESPSSLNITFPEVYLKSQGDERIDRINATMSEYEKSGVFKTYPNSMIYMERVQRDGRTLSGLVGAVDLEYYDYNKGSQSLIRATEGTILNRIPPRLKIRRNAPLETTHIILLFDDREKTVIKPIKNHKERFEKIYDFDLMMDSGHLSGYLLDDKTINQVNKALDVLMDQDSFNKKYGVNDQDVLLFAVGDGNHSLACAKTIWEELKLSLTPEERENHPARFALVEIMNIQNSDLEFEPIHRVISETDPQKLMDELLKFYPGISYNDNGGHKIVCLYGGREETIYIKDGQSHVSTGILQDFLNYYLEKNPGNEDYIHGSDVVRELSAEGGCIGFLLEGIGKYDFFQSIINDGTLPKKTFSMGHAPDKRFYLECKKIK